MSRLTTSKGTLTPFLYAKLNKTSPMLMGNHSRPTGLIARILRYGEDKWHSLSSHPSHSIRGRVYQLGNRLIDRIPMQERMLWRVYGYASLFQSKFEAPVPQIECSPEDDPAKVQSQLKSQLDAWKAQHGRWRLIHGLTIVPAVILSVLPFVKLWLAWEIFRTVTHHRAYIAAAWLRKGLGRRAAERLVANPELADSKNGFSQIDQELPSIIRKL